MLHKIDYEKNGHHITVSPLKGRIKITWDGNTLAESTHALELKEDDYEKVYYIPLKDVKAEVIRSGTRTVCPYKGKASYYSMKLNDKIVKDAIWQYADPSPEFTVLKDYVSFYTKNIDHVEITEG
jgi:uncharacterized protein (DUF427 family)